MFGIKQFSAIINPPQTAILAVGGGQEGLGKYITRIKSSHKWIMFFKIRFIYPSNVLQSGLIQDTKHSFTVLQMLLYKKQQK